MKITELILDCIFPSLCLACRKKIKTSEEKKFFLCEICHSKITTYHHFFCSECGNRLPNNNASTKCHPSAPPLAAASSYENSTTRELIHSLKYQNLTSALMPIKELIIKPYMEKILNQWSGINETIIVPIPLYKSKERRRGFNQAELIAKALKEIFCEINSENFNNPIISIKLLERVRNTPTQTEMKDRSSRSENIKNCFSLIKNWKLKVRTSNTIILVDDVFTSGATIKEAIRVLKNSGAKNIIAFVLAKT